MRRELVDWNDDLAQKLTEMLAGLRKHFPFYSPRYLAHMMSDQTIPSVLGYFAGLLYNPNNVTPEAAPVTERWEFDVGRDILEMVGYKAPPAPGGSARDALGIRLGTRHQRRHHREYRSALGSAQRRLFSACGSQSRV